MPQLIPTTFHPSLGPQMNASRWLLLGGGGVVVVLACYKYYMWRGNEDKGMDRTGHVSSVDWEL